MNENADIERKALKRFINMISEEELISFILGQQQAIDGLSKNNDAFRKYMRENISKNK